jgi:hypothetical protein
LFVFGETAVPGKTAVVLREGGVFGHGKEPGVRGRVEAEGRPKRGKRDKREKREPKFLGAILYLFSLLALFTLP